MIETPAHLEAQTREQQARAPYFGLGFKKDRLPPDLHRRMLESMQANAARFRAERAVAYEHNDDPATIPALMFEDPDLNAAVLRELQPLHEAWSGMPLVPSACYGVRVYQRGTILYNHVDRTTTHLISSTVCVDHRLRSRWPIYLEDVEGRGHQIDLEPGELVLYEGARLRHGRAYPLDGDYYAGIFVHYRPAAGDRATR